MSSIQVEQPSLSRQPSHQHINLDDIEFTGFHLRPASRRPSRTPIINIDDDDDEVARERYSCFRSNRTARSSISISIHDSEPPTNRRRVASGPRDHPVFVIDDSEDVEPRSNRRICNGAQSRPIVILDSDEEQGQASGSTSASVSTSRPRRNGVRRRGGRASGSFRIFSPSPPPRQHHPVPPVPPLPPIIAGPMPFAILPPPPNNNPGRNGLPFDEPTQSANIGNGGGIQLGGGLISQGSASGRRRGPRAQVRFQPHRVEDFDELFDEPAFNNPPPNPRGPSTSALEQVSRFGRMFASYLSANRLMSATGGASGSSSNPAGGRSRMSTGGLPPRSLRHLYNDFNNILDFGGERERYAAAGAGFFGFALGGLGPWGRRDAALGLGPDYDKSMTHPDRAGPGWTFDFGTDQEDEGASKVDGSEILVCAKCLDPLLANADGMVDVSEAEKKERRVWGLRCGHVLDGKCVGTLMRPEVEREVVKKDTGAEGSSKGKGKGKQKLVEPEDTNENEANVLVDVHDVKGKGKAPTMLAQAPTPPPLLPVRENTPLPVSLPPTAPVDLTFSPEDTSIRSRLRSRRSTGSLHTSSSSLPLSTNPSPTRPRRSTRAPIPIDGSLSILARSASSSSSTKRRGTKRKRGTNAKEEVIEDRYDWVCPVAGCARVHGSVRVGGVWKMDAERGAVGIYV